MKTSVVLTCIGPDRPGLVEALARVVALHEGNWVESQMTRLAGQFAGLLRVELPGANADELTRALEALSSDGLRITLEPADPGEPRAGSRLCQLSLVGRDHPGIVRDISQVLASRNVNVETLETSVSSAPESGEPLFRATASLVAPGSVSVEELRTRLEEIANDLMVDIEFASTT